VALSTDARLTSVYRVHRA